SLVAEAWRAKDHEKLGYASGEEYVHAQFRTHLLKLDKAVRRQWTAALQDGGMKSRQIACGGNVSHVTVAEDVKSLTTQASEDGEGVIDAEVVSDTADASEALGKLRKMVERAHTGIEYLATCDTLPADLAADQARAWHDMICGKRGKG